MNDGDIERFASALAKLAVVFNETMTKERAHGYWDLLSDLPVEDALRGLRDAARQSKFFPRPAEIREKAGHGVPDAGLINALISQHVSTIGGDRTAPDDEFVALCVKRLGGIYRASDMSAQDRLMALRGIIPGVAAAASARGIPMPSQAMVTDRHAQRLMIESDEGCEVDSYGGAMEVETPGVEATRALLKRLG